MANKKVLVGVHDANGNIVPQPWTASDTVTDQDGSAIYTAANPPPGPAVSELKNATLRASGSFAAINGTTRINLSVSAQTGLYFWATVTSLTVNNVYGSSIQLSYYIGSTQTRISTGGAPLPFAIDQQQLVIASTIAAAGGTIYYQVYSTTAS